VRAARRWRKRWGQGCEERLDDAGLDGGLRPIEADAGLAQAEETGRGAVAIGVCRYSAEEVGADLRGGVGLPQARAGAFDAEDGLAHGGSKAAVGAAGVARQGDGGKLGVVDHAVVGEGVEEDEAGDADGILRGGLDFDLFVLLDLGLESVHLVVKGLSSSFVEAGVGVAAAVAGAGSGVAAGLGWRASSSARSF